jgi:hypothetical protein
MGLLMENIIETVPDIRAYPNFQSDFKIRPLIKNFCQIKDVVKT